MKIKVRDPNGRTGAGQRSVDVSGDPAAVALACELIEELVAAEVVRLSSEGGPHTVQTLRVPGNLVGGVMGHRGERIMAIEKLTGAKLDLSKRLENDMREIRVSSGDAAAVERAVGMIQTAVQRELHGGVNGAGRPVQSQPAPAEKQRAAARRSNASAKTMLNDLALVRHWSPMTIDVSPGVSADARLFAQDLRPQDL